MSEETKNLADRIALREVELSADESFLIELYRSTREDLQQLPIADAQKNILVQMQCAAQKQHYAARFPNAAHNIILFDKEIGGRLLVDYGDRKIILVDIAILPKYRRFGIGTVLIKNLLDEAARTKRVFSLSVLKTNIAGQLYERLGLKIVEDTGTHFRMECRPAEINSES